MGGYENSVVYKNKQRGHFHTKVIRVFMGGEKVPNGTVREEDRERQRRRGGKLRLIVRQVIYEVTGALGPCQWKDRSSVAMAPSLLCVHCSQPRLGGFGDETGWRAAGAIVGLSAVVPSQGPVHLHHRQQRRSKAALFPLSKAHKPLKTSHNICTRG